MGYTVIIVMERSYYKFKKESIWIAVNKAMVGRGRGYFDLKSLVKHSVSSWQSPVRDMANKSHFERRLPLKHRKESEFEYLSQ